MTTAEAKELISKEFLRKFREWLDDYANMEERDYSKKYGYGRNPSIEVKDNLKGVAMFQKYIFSGRYLPSWEREGYDRKVIWELEREGFLSHQYDSSWMARQTGRMDFFYLSQKTAKQVYKESRLTMA